MGGGLHQLPLVCRTAVDVLEGDAFQFGEGRLDAGAEVFEVSGERAVVRAPGYRGGGFAGGFAVDVPPLEILLVPREARHLAVAPRVYEEVGEMLLQLVLGV